MEDIRLFKKANGLDRLVMVRCGSTEVYMTATEAHATMVNFERALEENDPSIPRAWYAYAAIREGIPCVNAAPNLSADVPALVELAAHTKSPLAGRTSAGQTLMKTIIAPGLKARLLGVQGCTRRTFSATATAKSWTIPSRSRPRKRQSPSSTTSCSLSCIRISTRICHVVRINYYPPRGDNKEGWDNIDLVGWLGYLMQLKINFSAATAFWRRRLCSTSRSSWIWRNAGMHGIQEWLSFYSSSPCTRRACIRSTISSSS
jgi:myo-inositol-1-phosphate synthase